MQARYTKNQQNKKQKQKNTKQTPFAEMLNFMYHNNSGTSTFRYAKKKPIL